MSKNTMHIVIVGGGAIGRLFGYFLSSHNHRVTIVDNDPEVVEALNTRGIEFMEAGELNIDAISAQPVRAVTDGHKIGSCDLTLLTVKSAATGAAAETVVHLVSPETPLMSMQAGLDNLDVLQGILPADSILVGFTFMTGTTLRYGRIRHGGMGITYIGELNGTFSDRLDRIHVLFQECGIETRRVRRIQGRLWGKVIVYSAINPVSAILRISNGCLVEKEESRELMRRLVEEGGRVAEACGVEQVYPDLWEKLLKTCKQSINNISPMLQDILNERPTEIDAQNGAICRYGREHGIDVSTQETMVRLIKLIEHWKPGSELRC